MTVPGGGLRVDKKELFAGQSPKPLIGRLSVMVLEVSACVAFELMEVDHRGQGGKCLRQGPTNSPQL